MAQTRDFRVRTTVPATPTAGVVAQYTDASGILLQVNENGTIYPVGQQWSGSINLMGGAAAVLAYGTGASPALAATTGTLTGAVAWLPIVGPSGQKFAFPV